jgi:DNA repair exonuclease SbcCD ATPase subunit
MALSGKAMRQDGWLYQAESLVSTHRPVAVAAITVAAKAREEDLSERVPWHLRAPGADFDSRQDWDTAELPHDPRLAQWPLDAIEPPAVREVSDEQLLHGQVEALAGQLAAAQRRIAELEASLGATFEQLDLQENENCSLRTSLDLLTGENSRLSGCLTESETLRVTAEKKLEEAQVSLLVLAKVKAVAKRDVAEAIDARNAAESKLEMLRNLLRLTDRQVQELEQSRSTLIEGTSELLKTFEIRDMALVRAEARNKALAERIAQLEAEARFASKPGKLEEFKRQWARLERSLTETAGKTMRGNGAAANGHSESAQKRSPQTALAGTITFVNAG